jgi:hypothetical protein
MVIAQQFHPLKSRLLAQTIAILRGERPGLCLALTCVYQQHDASKEEPVAARVREAQLVKVHPGR